MWPRSNAGQLGSVANAGNWQVVPPEEIVVADKHNRESWWHTDPASCTACIQRSVHWLQRARSYRIDRRLHQPRHPREDKSSKGSIAYLGCVPSKVVSRHRTGGMDLKCDKVPFREDSNRSSSACDRTWSFAWCQRKADSRGLLTGTDSCPYWMGIDWRRTSV